MAAIVNNQFQIVLLNINTFSYIIFQSIKNLFMINKKLSIIIPCFNEEDNIDKTYKKLSEILRNAISDYEIIFIENGSIDKSLNILKEIIKKDPHVLVLTFSRNFGPYGAFAGGLKYASGDAVVFIDCDLQDPPELIPRMLKKWQEGYEVVYGIRSRRKGGFLRKTLVNLYYRAFKKLSYINIPLDAGDFSLIDRKVVDVINSMPEHKRYLGGMRAWAGFKQIGIEYTRDKRLYGETKFSMLAYFRFAFENIFSFSYKPLDLISYLAIAVVGLSLVGIVVYFLYFLLNPNIPRGFPTLILVILFIGGIQLLCLSIISQYLANIFEEVKNRPHFVVRDVLGKNNKPKA